MNKRMEFIGANPSYYTFVATMEERVVGVIGVRQAHCYEGDGTVTQISVLVTRSNYQGKGIGKELIGFVEGWAEENGSNSLYLTSGIKPERVTAHAFYKKMGFDVTGYRFVKNLAK